MEFSRLPSDRVKVGFRAKQQVVWGDESLGDQVLNSPSIKAAKSESVLHGGSWSVVVVRVNRLKGLLESEGREKEMSNLE